MEAILARIITPLGLLAGFLLATGHTGGALALSVAAGACAWLVRSGALQHDLHRSREA
ncbi:hypothetical protein ACUH78_12865 [Thauera sp. ZXT1-4]|jgi:hypothetical protein|uniref:hypothetical protein n=1 Tax=Thauera sp. ZXT1-4 TaxID=3460294 RepID=UPI0040408A32